MKNQTLKTIHENLMTTANQLLPGNSRGYPVKPERSQVPVVPQERWALVSLLDSKALEKTFVFETIRERNLFVVDAIEIEDQHQHCSVMTLDGLKVHVRLHTKNLRIPTDIDKELATYLDEVYKDVCFASRIGGDFVG